MRKIVVLRLGHRPIRDKRITTHVCLVARAFGAEGIYIAGSRDEALMESLRKVVVAWGGPFWLEFTPRPLSLVKEWEKEGGKVVHLTMYGVPIRVAVTELLPEKASLLVVVGGEKVPREYYREADLNVAITNQPHSEAAALAIFLDRMTAGSWEDISFKDARLRIVPSNKGKIVEQLDLKKKDI
ncbi:MAG: tRNA (cytidine(56)-2'-O)-methyltransferase [Candidatus Methanomethylicaceae archaeon]